MSERNPAVFAAAGSVLIHEWDCANKLAENGIAKSLAARRSRRHGESGIQTTSSPDEFKIAADKSGRRNRCACRRR